MNETAQLRLKSRSNLRRHCTFEEVGSPASNGVSKGLRVKKIGGIETERRIPTRTFPHYSVSHALKKP